MFDNFKNLIRKGDKFIFVEDGKPAYVVMHYDDYEGMLARRSLDEGGSARRGTDDIRRDQRQDVATHNSFVPRDSVPKSSSSYAQPSSEYGQHSESRHDYNAKLVMDTPNVPEDISKIRLEDLPL